MHRFLISILHNVYGLVLRAGRAMACSNLAPARSEPRFLLPSPIGTISGLVM